MKKIVNIGLLTDSHLEDPNPGDVLIGLGIRYLLEDYFKKQKIQPIFSHINIFEHDFKQYRYMLDTSDTIVICGTPQLGVHEVPRRFNKTRYKALKIAKKKGIKLLNLWVGIVDQNNKRTMEESANVILNKHRNYIQNNFNIFDLIITRDPLTSMILDQCNISNTCLLDSVFHATARLKKGTKKRYNIITIKDTGKTNDIYLRSALIVYKQLQKIAPTYFLVHTIDNYNIYKNQVPNLVAINDPKSLVNFYAGALYVVSSRIHGAVPAFFGGANVMGISIDSRKYILKNAGIPYISQDSFILNPTLSFKAPNSLFYNRLKQDKAFIFKAFNKVFNNRSIG